MSLIPVLNICHQDHFIWGGRQVTGTFRLMWCDSPNGAHTHTHTQSLGMALLKNQYSETNVMHILLNLLRTKGLYMFRALLAHPQEARHKRHLVYCVPKLVDI
jgi:hypothetical protein